MSEHVKDHLSPDVLHAYFDGMLSLADARGAEAHLASCEACSTQAASLRAVFESLASLPDEPLAVDLRPAVLARLRRRGKRSGRIGWLLAIEAAGSAVALVAAWRWLAELLTSLEGLALEAWLASASRFLAELVERIGTAVVDSIAQAASLVEGFRLSLPQPEIPLSQSLGLVASAVALWFVGHRILLRSRPETRGLQEPLR
jgi:anti-sigma factor RsiW